MLVSWMAPANSQRESTDHVAAIESTVSLSCLRKRIRCSDRHADTSPAEAAIQFGKLPRFGYSIEAVHMQARAMSRHRLNAIRVHDASSRSHEIKASFELVTACKRKNGIDARVRGGPQLIGSPFVSCIDDLVRTERADETSCGFARCSGKHASANLRCKLDCHCADCAGGAKYEDRLPRSQTQSIDALECSQPCGSDHAGIPQIESLRNAPDVVSVGDCKFSVEATLTIPELVGIDSVAQSETSHSISLGHNDPCTVDSRYQRESRTSGFAPRAISD
jgi:hypothetical protein